MKTNPVLLRWYLNIAAFIGGLILLVFGLYLIWPPLAPTVAGATLVAVSVFDLRSKNEHPDATS